MREVCLQVSVYIRHHEPPPASSPDISVNTCLGPRRCACDPVFTGLGSSCLPSAPVLAGPTGWPFCSSVHTAAGVGIT